MLCSNKPEGSVPVLFARCFILPYEAQGISSMCYRPLYGVIIPFTFILERVANFGLWHII